MKYNGKESVLIIHMVLQVRKALEELGIQVPWDDNGPVCELDVPRNGTLLKVRREFRAEAARLLVTTILKTTVPADDFALINERLASLDETDGALMFVNDSGFLARSEVLEVLPKDVSPLFIGQLLDRSTQHLLDVAERVGITPKT